MLINQSFSVKTGPPEACSVPQNSFDLANIIEHYI
jgi:hypothetical protein